MRLNNLIFQDFVALDLCDETGEYDPGFDSHLSKPIFVERTIIDLDQWFLNIARNGGVIPYWNGISQ